MRNGDLLKNHLSEIRVKRIRVNQGVGVLTTKLLILMEIRSHPLSISRVALFLCRTETKIIGVQFLANVSHDFCHK